MSAALIIGPGAHFGAALCGALARAGSDVAVVSRTQKDDNLLRRQVEDAGRKFVSVPADVRNTECFELAIRQAGDLLEPFRSVIYNVKFSPKGPALSMAPEVLTDALAANVSGSLSIIRSAPKVMSTTGRRVIILTGGGFKKNPDYSRMPLSLSKAAINAMMTSLRLPLLDHHGIELKTLVIDGVVREIGPIYPDDVADAFLRLIENPARSTSTVRANPDPNQLSLEFSI